MLTAERRETLIADLRQIGDAIKDNPDLSGRMAAAVDEITRLTPRQVVRIPTPLIPEDPHLDPVYYNLIATEEREIGFDAPWLDRASRLPTGMQRELQDANDRLLIMDMVMCGRGDTQYASVSRDAATRMRRLKAWRTEWEPLIADYSRAIGVSISWVPTVMSAQLDALIQPELRVAALFEQWVMNGSPFKLPIAPAEATAFFIPEHGAAPATQPSAGNNTLTAVKIGGLIVASSEIDEDTAFALAPILRTRYGVSIGRAIEDTILNGDTNVNSASAQDNDMGSSAGAISTTANGTTTLTTAGNFFTSRVAVGDVITGGTPAPPAGTVVASITNATTLVMSQAITAGTEPQSRTFSRPVTMANHNRIAWDGVRKKALISNMPNVDWTTVTDDKIASVWKPQGRFGQPGDGAWIVGMAGLGRLYQNKDSQQISQFFGPEILGSFASMQPGQVAMLQGRPVILSEFMREDLDGTGKNTAVASSGLNLTCALHVCRRAFALGTRRGITLRRGTQPGMVNNEVYYLGTWRGDFKELYTTAAAANKIVGIGRNFN